jgi:hypothetical protein
MRAEYTSQIRNAEKERGMRNFDPLQGADEESGIPASSAGTIRLEYELCED